MGGRKSGDAFAGPATELADGCVALGELSFPLVSGGGATINQSGTLNVRINNANQLVFQSGLMRAIKTVQMQAAVRVQDELSLRSDGVQVLSEDGDADRALTIYDGAPGGSAHVLTLTGSLGSVRRIANHGGGAVDIKADGAEDVDGSSGQSLAAGAAVVVWYDGGAWFRVGGEFV